MPANLPDRVQTVIVEHLGCPDRFRWDADLRDDLGADSLDAVELAHAVEEEFGIQVSDAAADAWRTPDDMLATVEGRVDG